MFRLSTTRDETGARRSPAMSWWEDVNCSTKRPLLLSHQWQPRFIWDTRTGGDSNRPRRWSVGRVATRRSSIVLAVSHWLSKSLPTFSCLNCNVSSRTWMNGEKWVNSFRVNSNRGQGQPSRIERDFTNPVRILGLSLPPECCRSHGGKPIQV